MQFKLVKYERTVQFSPSPVGLPLTFRLQVSADLLVTSMLASLGLTSVFTITIWWLMIPQPSTGSTYAQ